MITKGKACHPAGRKILAEVFYNKEL